MAGRTIGLNTYYSAKELTKEARSAVKGLGRYAGWDIEIHEPGNYGRLIAYYVKAETDGPNKTKSIARVTILI